MTWADQIEVECMMDSYLTLLNRDIWSIVERLDSPVVEKYHGSRKDFIDPDEAIKSEIDDPDRFTPVFRYQNDKISVFKVHCKYISVKIILEYKYTKTPINLKDQLDTFIKNVKQDLPGKVYFNSMIYYCNKRKLILYDNIKIQGSIIKDFISWLEELSNSVPTDHLLDVIVFRKY